MASNRTAHTLAHRSYFDKLPDELLLKILAFVPHSGHTRGDTVRAIRQHDTLKLVYPRFKSVISTKAFKTELVRCQYNDVAQLRGITSIKRNQEFQDIIAHSSKIDNLVTTMMYGGEGDTLRSMLRAGMLILDYLNNANTYQTVRARLMLVEWVLNSVFSNQFQLILRFTICRLLETFWDLYEDVATIAPDKSLSDLERIERRPQSGADAIVEMRKYRAFETALFLNTDCCSLLRALDRCFEDIVNDGATEYWMLEADVFDREEGTDENLFDTNFAKYIDGYQWRLLSPRTMEGISQTDPSIQSEFSDPIDILLDEEAQHGIKSFKALKSLIQSSHATNDVLDVNFKAVGEFLRYAKDEIEKGDEGVPEHVVKFVNEAVSLREYLRNATDFNS